MYPNAHWALADKAQSMLLANIFSLSPCTTYYIVVGIWALRNSSRGIFQTRNLLVSKHKTDDVWHVKDNSGFTKILKSCPKISNFLLLHSCEICLTEY